MLSKDQILSANDLPTIDVEVPEWQGTARLRTLTAGDRETWEKVFLDSGGRPKPYGNVQQVRATLVALCLVDEVGARLFTDAEIESLAGKSAAAMDRVYEAALKLNRVSKGDVEELAGN